MNKLVIVESPNKIKSIEKYLGEGYKVMASKGHVVLLPSKGKGNFGVDMETWTPLYEIDPDKKKIVNDLKKESDKADHVYIATDPDREGEAIGENLVTFLELEEGKYSRITYNEITKEAINKAMEKPTEINYQLVNAQVARRIIDRIIGYKLSGLLRRKIYGAPTSPSAGRVQSIALKLVVEREKLVDAFVPVKYFNAKAILKDNYEAELVIEDDREDKTWINPEEVSAIEAGFKGALTVTSIKTTKRKDKKKTPFKQSSLYKAADSKLGMSASSAQRAMQRLFEIGLISYPRTDSTKLSETFINTAKGFISKKYGPENVSNDVKGTSGDQNAHEAIRPTDVALMPDEAKAKHELESSEHKLYNLIWTHTVQVLMNVPQREMLRYNLEENGNTFKLTSSKVVYMGYLLVTSYEQSRELPVLKEGEVISVEKYDMEEKATKPPARYNDGSLIETLDEIKVGRPSTFATTINVLKKRAYVTMEGKALKPTPFGKIVLEKLVKNFPEIMKEQYTANIEDDFDKVAEGKMKKEPLLDEFWINFDKQMESATQTIEITKIIAPKAGKDCPECGSDLLIRTNKRDGTTFFGCSAFPKCKHLESDPNAKKKFFKKKWPAKK